MSRRAAPEAPVPGWEDLRPTVTDELLADITRRIVNAFQPHKILLFGSHAYGTPHADSDVDLLIIMDSDEPVFPRMRRVDAVARVPFLSMDVLVYTPAEIKKRLAIGDFFIAEILAKGRVLYQRGLLDEWLEKAESDFQAAAALNRLRKQPLPDVVCYECAQCAEKYLKAYLIAQGATPPYTHDLVRLLNLCVPYDADFASRLALVQILNPYGVAVRYPGLTATIVESKEAVRILRRLRLFVRRKLGL